MAFSYTRCEGFIAAMTDLIAAGIPDDARFRQGLGGGVQPSDGEVLDLVEEHELTLGDFIELDERPGQFDPRYRQNDWHRLLRVVRNNPDNHLFEVLRRHQ